MSADRKCGHENDTCADCATGTLIEQRDRAEAERDAAKAELARARSERDVACGDAVVAHVEAATAARRAAFSEAAFIVRQGCGFAPPHRDCDHESIAVAIEGFRDGGMDGMIAALDRMKVAPR